LELAESRLVVALSELTKSDVIGGLSGCWHCLYNALAVSDAPLTSR
jgi:hypothetical protein